MHVTEDVRLWRWRRPNILARVFADFCRIILSFDQRCIFHVISTKVSNIIRKVKNYKTPRWLITTQNAWHLNVLWNYEAIELGAFTRSSWNQAHRMVVKVFRHAFEIDFEMKFSSSNRIESQWKSSSKKLIFVVSHSVKWCLCCFKCLPINMNRSIERMFLTGARGNSVNIFHLACCKRAPFKWENHSPIPCRVCAWPECECMCRFELRMCLVFAWLRVYTHAHTQPPTLCVFIST